MTKTPATVAGTARLTMAATTKRERGLVARLATAVESKRASQRDRMRVRRVALAASEEARITAQLRYSQQRRRLAT